MTSLRPGGSFGDYKVVRLLGKGSTGSVWLLEIPSRVRRCAAKILSRDLARNHAHRSMFMREAVSAMEIRHPNLVRVYDVGEDPETELCYILMEYASGGTLADKLKKEKRLPVQQAATVVRSIASLLDELSSRGMVHRDIKPGNILFADGGVAKLSDLGIVRSNGQSGAFCRSDARMMGTPAYMAPEQMLDSEAVDIRADIYSLGVVFFEMLAGRRPFSGSDMIRLVARSVAGEVPDIRDFRPDVSESIANIVRMMCAPNAEERVRSPHSLVSLIDWALKEVE
jgi:serine/threonine-protein kinase